MTGPYIFNFSERCQNCGEDIHWQGRMSQPPDCENCRRIRDEAASKARIPDLSTIPAIGAKKWARRGAMSLRAALEKAKAEYQSVDGAEAKESQ